MRTRVVAALVVLWLLPVGAVLAAPLPPEDGGTGVENVGALTVPITGTAALLEVANTFALTQTVNAPIQAQRLAVGSVTLNENYGIHARYQNSQTANPTRGMYLMMEYGAAGVGNMTKQIVGISNEARTSSAYTANITQMVGGLYAAENWGSGTVAQAIAGQFYVAIQNAATAGKITSGYGIQVRNAVNNGPVGSSITNQYGMYINDLTTATSTNVAIQTGAGTVRLGDDTAIGSGSPDRRLHATDAAAATDAVIQVQRLTAEMSTTSNPVAGFGTGLEFEAENGSKALAVINRIEGVYTDPTDSAEDSVLKLYAMDDGTLVEVGRLGADGVLLHNGTALADPFAGATSGETYTLPSGETLTLFREFTYGDLLIALLLATNAGLMIVLIVRQR